MTFQKTKTVSRFYGFDIMKFIMAMAIMSAHICSENVTVHPFFKLLTSVYNFGVPFFFACSGYLFFRKFNRESYSNRKITYVNFTRRILSMYAVWSIIYFCFVLINWIQEEASVEVVVQYFHTAAVFTTYSTIWFLPSLWIGVSIVYFLFARGLGVNKMAIASLFTYVIGSFGHSYASVIDSTVIGEIYEIYDSIFITTRNGIFAGFPFVMVGAYLARRDIIGNVRIDFILMILFSSLFICEAIYIKTKFSANVDMGLMLVPSTFYMMKWLIQLDLPFSNIFGRLRNLSMLIFLSQRLFITAIPSILPMTFMSEINKFPYIGLLSYISLTLLFSLVIEYSSKKYRWVKVLW